MRKTWVFLLFLYIVMTSDSCLAVEGAGILKIAPTKNSIVLRWPFCSKMALEDIYVEVFRQGSQGGWQKIAVIVPDLRSIASAFAYNPEVFRKIKTQVLVGGDDRLAFLLYLKGFEDLDLARYMCIAYEDRDVDKRKFYRYRVVYIHKGEVLETYESIGFTSISEYQDVAINLNAYADTNNAYLKWNTPDNIVFYRIYRNGRSLFPYPFLISKGEEKEDYFVAVKLDGEKADYFVEGIDWAGNRFRSQVVSPRPVLPRLQKEIEARPIDSDREERLSLAPEIKEVRLRADESGNVVVQWRFPLDMDYEGVLIWRSLDGGRSFVLLTPHPTRSNSYMDKFYPCRSMPERVFYKLCLIDGKGRESKEMVKSISLRFLHQTIPAPLLLNSRLINGRLYLDLSCEEGVADEVLCEIISDGKIIREMTQRPGRIVVSNLPRGDFEVKIYSIGEKGARSAPLILELPGLSFTENQMRQ